MSDTATAKAQASDEMQRLFGVVTDSLTDGMIERAAGTAGNLLEVADHISGKPEQIAAAAHSKLHSVSPAGSCRPHLGARYVSGDP